MTTKPKQITKPLFLLALCLQSSLSFADGFATYHCQPQDTKSGLSLVGIRYVVEVNEATNSALVFTQGLEPNAPSELRYSLKQNQNYEIGLATLFISNLEDTEVQFTRDLPTVGRRGTITFQSHGINGPQISEFGCQK